MLLTITYEGKNTADLGYLLYKNPYRPQVIKLNHGKAYVFYPEVSDEKTTVALFVDIDPIDLARGKVGKTGGGLFDYVNDRPYVASSFMSTAIARVFGTAMTGRADAHQELSDSKLDLSATVTMLPCKGEQDKLKAVFEPLGYEVNYESFLSDEKFPEWGNSKYVNLTIKGRVRLRDLLKHLYVLIPVFDKQKHYWIGVDEVDKLMRSGEEWLVNHPQKGYITSRYLYRKRSLANMAFERLASENTIDGEVLVDEKEEVKEIADKKVNLNAQRLDSVITVLKNNGVKSVIDLGCGEGNLLVLLSKEKQFKKIRGMDVSYLALQRAYDRLKLERASETMNERVQLFQGSLTYKDKRLSGFDAACVIEVIEHLDVSRLVAFERVLFEFTKPPIVVLTTPNMEYNANYQKLNEADLRHGDHRFEWTRKEFKDWANKVAEKFNYSVQFSEIGDKDTEHGAPTQMGVFISCE